ncbi:hypothetical protein DM872_14275 [Pseudomonas taiwanensis]|uniref:ATP-binding protein n=1 Tax=Pseudomonas taiwanensis TaxID=470150 RepID=UPI0015BC0463|nr:SbcC/MukB-like Walker B domain-containing protein [Pseudomonas taiwanensis]NWL78019.1 hypothetical protein [Pseudomonas taiwanensis]
MPEATNLVLRDLIPDTPYLLTGIDLFNWGSFGNRHTAEIDLRGTAIIGQTGSGKTTLIDAFMTLITAQPRYNLASTGGHESDRDLVSYVRGVSGAGRSGDMDHIARPQKTVTGIAARFRNEQDTLCIGALFAFDGSSSSPSDLDRIWLFSRVPGMGLDDWLEHHHVGGNRALKSLAKETPGLFVNESKVHYLAQLRRFFDVGENAFTLLNRAAGLKQLNSIDDLFRELVLDDHSAFQRAAEVASEFDNLTAIHQELEVARKQRDSLLPIAPAWQSHNDLLERKNQCAELLRIAPIWFATKAYQLWGTRLQSLNEELRKNQDRRDELEPQRNAQAALEQTLRDTYLQSGGSSIEALREEINWQRGRCRNLEGAADEYRRVARKLELDETISRESFHANKLKIDSLAPQLESDLKALEQAAWDQGVLLQAQSKALEDLERELHDAKSRPNSNIPSEPNQFRTALAEYLGLDNTALPFLAELVEVKSEEAQWRGAIERAIGAHRLRILVPSESLKSALRWVNGRHNDFHVRLLDAREPKQPAVFFEDGFTRKLTFKPKSPYLAAVKKFLSGIDRHCVGSAEALEGTEHGMTAQGLMSGKAGLYDKQDNIRLEKGWLTGFDNSDQLRELALRLIEARELAKELKEACEAAQAKANLARQKHGLLEPFVLLRYDDIDLPGAEQALQSLQERLKLLEAPDSDTAQAKERWSEVKSQLTKLDEALNDLKINQGVLAQDVGACTENQSHAYRRTGAGLSDAHVSLSEEHFHLPTDCEAKSVSDHEQSALRGLVAQQDKLSEKILESSKTLVRLMENAKKEDQGPLVDVRTELEDVPSYLERLRILIEEALPEKQQRFLDYLNQSSDQGVTQLLRGVDNQVSIIEERIGELNDTMRRVDFQPGRYLRLEPKQVVHDLLKALHAAQRVLLTAALKDDQGESHFRALAHIINMLRDASERKATLGAKALLDPRYRLHFSVSVIERETGATIETRTGSQGGSGGEKEIIASYILTASLSYALCPDGSSKPLFGTIILDEAFSKSSQAVAGRIISALREFGLHPLFVTPNKEMRLLRAHTRSAILIHRKGQQSTMTSLSWEELEAAKPRESDQQ